MAEVNIHEAKTHLSKLLARVAAGEEIIISKAGKPVARLVPFRAAAKERTPGLDRGKGLASQGMLGLAVQHAHALRVAALPDHHRDPFDRLLVAQAQTEGFTVLTADPLIAAFDGEALWAGQGPSPW